jgi:hypothetical protein
MIIFSAEICKAETGDESQHNGLNASDIIRLVRHMADGDALVINARQETPGEI